MALIRCPRCMQRISDTVESCPECEYRFTPEEIAKNNAKNKKAKDSEDRSSIHLWFLCYHFYCSQLNNTRINQQREIGKKQAKNSTGTSTDISQPESSKFPGTQSPSSPATSAPRPSELPETETQQEADRTGPEAWFGTWSLEFHSGTSLRRRIWRGSLQSDIFLSWNHTFHTDGRFESKLRQEYRQGNSHDYYLWDLPSIG